MQESKKRTALLGLAFLAFLFLSSYENTIFFSLLLGEILKNQFLAVGMLFLHNVLVVSMILLGMNFYVSLVKVGFFKNEGKYAYIVLEHPRVYALTFTVIIVFLSILRGSTLIYGGVSLEALPTILLMSTPVGLVEGYGIYMTIKNTLSQTLKTKDLAVIYGIFLAAALLEVALINVLITILKFSA
ncbi:MAG: hypothetical protein NZ932_03730 [Candidatus Bathyarchaeota archaeon]|nr:hypothetical protein [Candidatus Bathyarchaeota archaeon]MDW8040744.1 hypothetical protein [Nitrososphaerota archaeon]